MGKRAPAVKRTQESLAPANSVLIVDGDQLEAISPSELSVARVGHKAVGLASIPALWIRPFFVVCGFTVPTARKLDTALARCGIRPGAKLFVRSSGIAEAI